MHPSRNHANHRSPHFAGFSLMETVLALGLLAAVLLPLLGVMGSTSLRQQRTVDRSQAAYIGASVFDAIAQTPAGQPIRFSRVLEDGEVEEIQLGELKADTKYFLSFDREANPVRALSSGEAQAAVSRPVNDEAYVVEIVVALAEIENRPEMAEVRVTIESPIEARKQDRRSEVLTTFTHLEPQ